MAKIKRIVHLSRFEATSIGHGGVHRSYQINFDLSNLGDNQEIIKIPYSQSSNSVQNQKTKTTLISKIKQRYKLLTSILRNKASPYGIIGDFLSDNFNDRNSIIKPDLIRYKEILQISKIDLCIIEDPIFYPAIEINRSHKIPTIICPQNLETFDSVLLHLGNHWSQIAFISEFIKELQILARCEERLFVSKVETSLVEGLGYQSEYYPYLPVGEILDQLCTIRQRRIAGNLEKGLVLIIGSAAHASTAESQKWWLECAKEFGLPPTKHFIIIGQDTEKLLDKGPKTRFEYKGWVDQSDLNDLLAKAELVVIPQRTGFGALTRMPEMACAGIPLVVSRYSTYAQDPPPGSVIVDDDWDQWYTNIDKSDVLSAKWLGEKYDDWAKNQLKPLQRIVRRYL